MKNLGIYIHIPFCVRKCLYCDFLSFPEGEERQALYFRALKKEIEMASFECRDYIVDTVFIGGGTPTIADPVLIADLMDTLRQHYNVAGNAEITIECNPKTAGIQAFKIYKSAGINRLSIGLQSSKDGELKLLGRIHDLKDFETCYEDALEAGFTNINIDLMSSLPGQSARDYKDSLEYVCNLDPAPRHISAYSLIVEEGTPFYEKYSSHEELLPSEDEDRKMYHLTGELLKKHGYERYEISNYAQKGFECIHNKKYWKCEAYLGFGIGASSYMNEMRFHNTEDFDLYIDKLSKINSDFPYSQNGIAAEIMSSDKKSDTTSALLSIREDVQALDKKAMMEEFMFMGLRMIEGVSNTDFRDRFNAEIYDIYGDRIAKLREKELLVYEDDRIKLTEKGLDVSNYCMAEFLL